MKTLLTSILCALLIVSFASALNPWSEYVDPPWSYGVNTFTQLKVLDDYALGLSYHRYGVDDYSIFMHFYDGMVWKNVSIPSYSGFDLTHVTRQNIVNLGKSCDSDLFYVGLINSSKIKVVSFNPVTESFSDVSLFNCSSVVFPVHNSIVCLDSGECYIDELKGSTIHRFLPSYESINHPGPETSTGIFGRTSLYVQAGGSLSPYKYMGEINGTDVWNISGDATDTGINSYYQLDDNTAVYSTITGHVYVANNSGWFVDAWDAGWWTAAGIDPVIGDIHYSVNPGYSLWNSPYRQDDTQAIFMRNVSSDLTLMDFACTESQGWAMSDTGYAYQYLSNGTCGNGQIDPEEDCDGFNLDGYDCQSLNLGFIKGDLYCNADCTFLTSFCESGGFDPWESPSMGVVPTEPFEQEELPDVPESELPVVEKTKLDFAGLWERLIFVWDFIFTEPLKALGELFNSFKLFWLEWIILVAVLVAAIVLGKKELSKKKKKGRRRRK